MLISDLSSTQMMLLVLPIIPNMWALNHCFHHDFPTEKEKFRWMMACVFLPCIGGIAYFLVGRRHASKDRINVFERYGKKEQGGSAEGGAGLVAGAAAGASMAGTSGAGENESEAIVHPEEPLEYEERARAPWDDEPAAPAVAEEAPAGLVDTPAQPRPEVKDWDFGCPEDVRKN